MPKILLVSEDITLEVAPGTKFPDAIDNSDSSFPFGCRLGSCGTCRCIVEEGIENINELTRAENDLFENLTYVGKNERLGCQLIIKGDVKIRG